MRAAWWKERVFYQIYPRSFQDSNGDGIGDIPGIISEPWHYRYVGKDAAQEIFNRDITLEEYLGKTEH